MAVISASQHSGYFGGAMSAGLEVPPAGGFSNVAASNSQKMHVRALSAYNNSSFGNATAWETAHTGGTTGVPTWSAERSGTFVNFNTNRVDPMVR